MFTPENYRLAHPRSRRISLKQAIYMLIGPSRKI